jgi:hypothetical protein
MTFLLPMALVGYEQGVMPGPGAMPSGWRYWPSPSPACGGFS